LKDMNYLSPAEFEAYGLETATPVAWVTAASALLDAHCRRETLGVKQYRERLGLSSGRNRVRLTYLPLAAVAPATTPIVSARGRYAPARRGEGVGEMDWAADVAQAFGLPGLWTELDASAVDYSAETGELVLPTNPLGWGFGEVEITYTAGLENIPDAVKCACAQMVRNALATPALNVRAGNLERMHLEYFADTLVDETVRTMLAPYVAQKVG
jgi:hypothetical protein